MKRLFYAFIVGVILLGCSNQDDFMAQFKTSEPEFPSHIEKYGKELAKSIKQTVAILNKQGADYSDANYSKAFHDKFYGDWLNASPSATKSKITIKQVEIDPLVLAEKYRNLTPVQLKFIDKIINEGSKSNSYEEFCVKIKEINNGIYNEVPKIEQERLLHITSALYYGLSEIYHLQMQGQMLITPQTNLQFAMVKTRSESDGGGIWGTCRKIYEVTCSYVVGAIIYTGEVVSSISWEAIITATGTVMMFAVILCLTGDTGPESDRQYCINNFNKCHVPGNPLAVVDSGGWGRSMCDLCYDYCISRGFWSCPVPI